MERTCRLDECPELGLPGCSAPAAPGRYYCSPAHRAEFARRRYRLRKKGKTPPPTTREERGSSPDQQASEERTEQVKEQLLEKQRVRTLRELERTQAKRELVMGVVRDCLTPFKPSPPLKLRRPDAKTKVSWCLDLSDWHLGEKTSVETTSGMYEQDIAKTHEQVQMLVDAITSIYYEAKGRVVEALLINVLGDIVTGDALRPSQLRQIEKPVVMQTVDAWNLLCVFIRSLLQLPIPTIDVEIVGGNHDRITTKPGLAGLGETDYVDTFSYLIGAFLEQAFADEPRVNIHNWETFFGHRWFAGKVHVFEHGSSIKSSGGSYGGMPWYPIHNAGRQYAALLSEDPQYGRLDFFHLGHFHSPYNIPVGQGGWIIGNGALPATSPYSQSRFKTIREPIQWLLEIHKDTGITKLEPLYAGIGLPGQLEEEVD